MHEKSREPLPTTHRSGSSLLWLAMAQETNRVRVVTYTLHRSTMETETHTLHPHIIVNVGGGGGRQKAGSWREARGTTWFVYLDTKRHAVLLHGRRRSSKSRHLDIIATHTHTQAPTKKAANERAEVSFSQSARRHDAAGVSFSQSACRPDPKNEQGSINTAVPYSSPPPQRACVRG